MPIKQIPGLPMLVLHPIFEYDVVCVMKDGKMIPVQITKNQTDLEMVLEKYQEQINMQKNVFGIYMIIRKSYRLTFLKFIKKYLSKTDFSLLLADAWTTTENPNQDINVNLKTLKKWFIEADKSILMSEDDYKVYLSLPDEFEVYRGVTVNRNPDGFSWTKDKEKAIWFANRFNNQLEKGYVRAGMADKKNVLAYFNTRSENEIVIDPATLKNETILSF